MEAKRQPDWGSHEGKVTLILDLVTNLTTQMEIAGIKSKTKKKIPVEVLEFDETSLGIDLPKASCAEGHHLLIAIRSMGGDNPLQTNLTGKVTDTTKIDSERLQVNLQLLQYEKEVWDQLRKIFEQRQYQLISLFESIKD